MPYQPAGPSPWPAVAAGLMSGLRRRRRSTSRRAINPFVTQMSELLMQRARNEVHTWRACVKRCVEVENHFHMKVTAVSTQHRPQRKNVHQPWPLATL